MRKYQQLILLVTCAFCIWFLLLYKNENNRLKVVLQAINFFSRNDAEVVRQIQEKSIDEIPSFLYPAPVWRSVGESHYAYSAFWIRNELISGGEALAIVVGNAKAAINFKCSVIFDGGSRVIRGKFRFQRVNETTLHRNQDFINYNFICRLTTDYGKPDFVKFIDNSKQNRSSLNIRLGHTNINMNGLRNPHLTVCLDLIDGQINLNSIWNNIKFLQLFFQISKLGVENVLIYNGDVISENTLRVLKKLKFQLHLIPFNFPYSLEEPNSKNYIRHSLNIDCLLRSIHIGSSTLILKENEFVFWNSNQFLKANELEKSNQVELFEISVFNVCMDFEKKLLIDNSKYDPEVKPESKIYLYRSALSPYSIYSDNSFKSFTLPISKAFAHRYIKCDHVGSDGLHNWSTSLREDFSQQVKVIRDEMQSFIDKI